VSGELAEGYCRLCGSAALRERTAARGYQFYTCKGCGYAQLDPLPPVEEINAIYATEYFKKAKYAADPAALREQARRIAYMRRAGVPDGATVIDLGCASGDFIASAKAHYDCWGMDISESGIETAKALNPEIKDQILFSEMQNYQLPERSFDAITMWDVVEHLPDPSSFLANAVTRLKPGGVLMLSTPNFATVSARLLGKRWAFMTPPEHLGFFSPNSTSRWLTSHGLESLFWTSKGRWVNTAFLAYKARRVFPEIIPQKLVDSLRVSSIGKVCLYVPTADVLYMAARKSA
jgi:2-polyprenyl-3-methyl-5-hydroxy-6-metoxy-1,4-benzoquinol methylase